MEINRLKGITPRWEMDKEGREKRPPKGILFDLDDTILVYSAVAEPIWRALCRKYAPEAAEDMPERLFQTIMAVSRWYWSDKERHKKGRLSQTEARREIVGRAFERLGLPNRDHAFALADRFSEERDTAVYPFEGALETLEYLKDRGIRLALMTNGEARRQREKIRRFHLERFFTCILVEGEIGFGKPEKEVYLQALRGLNLGPEEVWAVGDHLEWDVAGPKRLGVLGIWHDHEKKGLPAGSPILPDRIIHRIAELVPLSLPPSPREGG